MDMYNHSSIFLRFTFLLLLGFVLQACSSGGGDSSGTNTPDPVTPVNQQPIAVAGDDQQLVLGTGTIALDASASSDPDSDPLTFAWNIVSAPGGSTASIISADSAFASFTPDVVGIYAIELRVSDGEFEVTDEVVIDVAVNIGPTANAGVDQDLSFNVLVTLDGSASSDPEGQPLSYTWTQRPGYGPDVTGGTGNLSGVRPTFTAPAEVVTLLFDLKVNDGNGESFADTVQINIFENAGAAIFVSPSGNDGWPGSRAQPKLTLAAAIAAAAQINGDVYAAYALFNTPTLDMRNGVSFYGGFRHTYDWLRPYLSTYYRTGISSSGTVGVRASNLTSPTRLDQITIYTVNSSSMGGSVYGVLAAYSPGLIIHNSRIQSSRGYGGYNGTTPITSVFIGGNGGRGVPGCEDGGTFCDSCSRPSGGTGGTGYGGRNGGTGGVPNRGSYSGANGQAGLLGGAAGGIGTPYGQGNANWLDNSSYLGHSGASGAAGSNGIAGYPGYSSSGYSASAGGTGSTGYPGQAGGGGGGGGGGDDNCDSFGGGGGGGGGAGGPGAGGTGGGPGGGSFAVYLWASSASIRNSQLVTIGGGNGGNGAGGQYGGAGGIGGRSSDPTKYNAGNNYGGTSEQDDGSNGGRGGNGGAGGRGGHGGGGAGGPSVGIVRAGGSSPIISEVTYTIGEAGTGGYSLGNSGPNGVRTSILIP